MKRSLGFLCCFVALCAAAPAPSTREIFVAERARSLDNLATYLDGSPLLAARAALAIGRTKDSNGAAALRAHLGAADARVRAMCAYALGLLADRSALATLQRLARRDPSSAVRYGAVDAVGRIVTANPPGTLALATDLLNVTRRDADATVRGHAAANLDAFRSSPGAQQIAFALQRAFKAEHDRAVRWHIMWTLSRGYATLTARTFFAHALSDADDTVRLAAVRGVGRQNDANAARLLTPLLRDPSWRVQEETAEALHRLSGTALTEHLSETPAGLHLPPLPYVAESDAAPLPRPTASTPPIAPATGDARFDPLPNPQSAALMNGPMPGPHPRVRITTSKGTVVVRLYPEWAPYTVANFLNLTNSGFFDGNRWFRIVPDFVVQTGDHTNTGEGDAGYSIGAEENPVEQRAGVISMGLNYDKEHPLRDSAGSQFYITLSPQLHLDRDFTVFGEVERGFDVLPHLVEADTMRKVEQIADD